MLEYLFSDSKITTSPSTHSILEGAMTIKFFFFKFSFSVFFLPPAYRINLIFYRKALKLFQDTCSGSQNIDCLCGKINFIVYQKIYEDYSVSGIVLDIYDTVYTG